MKVSENVIIGEGYSQRNKKKNKKNLKTDFQKIPK